MRARLIVNPSSGTGRASAQLSLVTGRLRTIVSDLDVTTTEDEHGVVDAAKRAADERCELLFIAGGDGTINRVLRALVPLDGALDRITLGVIPSGTGNDFAKALDLGEVLEPAIDALLETQVVDVDIGMVNDRAFVNISAGGFVADVSATASEGLKEHAGKLAYVLGGARALLGREPFAAEIRLPDGGGPPFGGPVDLQMFAVCNAPFIGGGHPIAADALIDDGLMDVVMVKHTPTLEFVGVLQKIAAGDLADDERILRFRAGDLDLAFDRSVNVNTDGEVLQADRCSYRVRQRAARFLCGPHPRSAAPARPLRR